MILTNQRGNDHLYLEFLKAIETASATEIQRPTAAAAQIQTAANLLHSSFAGQCNLYKFFH